MVRFLWGPDPNISQKLKLQPYQSFEDISKLAIKVDEHYKNKRIYTRSYSWPSPPIKSQITHKAKATSKDSKGLYKGKNIANKFSNKLDSKIFINC